MFDTETRTTPDQRLIFLVWRLVIEGILNEEGIAYANDLDEAETALLRAYASEHVSAADPAYGRPPGEPLAIKFVPLRTFLTELMADLVTCPNCNRTFSTQAHGASTRCGTCNTTVYVPVAIRCGPPRRRRTGNPLGRPREPKPDKAPASVAARRYEPRIDPVATVLGYATATTKVIAARTAQATRQVVSTTPALVPMVPALEVYRAPVILARERRPKCATGTGHCDLPGCPL